jgi:hypothetical protein
VKDLTMASDWRTVQLFLSEEGVAEVQVDSLQKHVARCDCRSYRMKSKCEHVKYIQKIMEANDGHYTVHIPVEIKDEEAEEAMKNAESFRNFIIKYAKVEVL